jgi:splicing factor 3B subunit 3
MISFSQAALEKQKLVYLLSGDSAGSLNVSSPLEAHSSNSILFSATALDVGNNNPIVCSSSW